MKIFTAAFFLVLAFSMIARADAPWASAEHLYYVRIETDPPDATLMSVPAKEDAEATVIGHTPCVIPLEMNWGRSYLQKSWAKLRVTTRGNIATNEFDKESKDQTVLLNFAIEKPGYARQIVQEIAGAFQYDDHADDWDHAINELPEKRTLTINLVPLADAPTNGDAPSGANAKPASLRTVLVASGNKGGADSPGYALIEAAEGTPVYCDGILAGTAPMRLMLSAGEHKIHTLLNRKPTPVQTIKIEAGKTGTVTLPD